MPLDPRTRPPPWPPPRAPAAARHHDAHAGMPLPAAACQPLPSDHESARWEALARAAIAGLGARCSAAHVACGSDTAREQHHRGFKRRTCMHVCTPATLLSGGSGPHPRHCATSSHSRGPVRMAMSSIMPQRRQRWVLFDLRSTKHVKTSSEVPRHCTSHTCWHPHASALHLVRACRS